MTEITTTQDHAPAPVADVLVGPGSAWIIARGEYDDLDPVAVVQGTEEDARRHVDRINAATAGELAYVWREVEFIAAPIV